MNDHPNTRLMQRAYDAFGAGDFETLSEVIAQDAVWHQPGNNPLAGDYVGRDAIFEHFARIMELSGGTFKAEVIDIVADDERAMALHKSSATRDGDNYETKDVLVSEIRDGKVVETQLYTSDPETEDRFWSG